MSLIKHKRKQSMPPLEKHSLQSLLASGKHMQAECNHCGAYQAVDLSSLIQEHGPFVNMASAAKEFTCFFCKEKGANIKEIFYR